MGVGLVADVGPEATTRFFEFFMVPVRNKNTRIVYYHAIGEFLAWSQRCGFLVWKTSKCIPCRAQTTLCALIPHQRYKATSRVAESYCLGSLSRNTFVQHAYR